MAYKMTKARVRQLRRVRSLIRSFKKRGFEFDVETGVMLRDLSKVSTVQLAKIKPEYLYKRSTKVVDGQRVSGLRGRNIEYERRSQKAAQTRKRNQMVLREKYLQGFAEGIEPDEAELIVKNFEDIIQQYDTWASGFILSILEQQRSYYGVNKLAAALEALPQGLKDRIVAFAFNSGNGTQSMVRAIVAAMHAIEILAERRASTEEITETLREVAQYRGKGSKAEALKEEWVNRIVEEMEFE